MNDSPEIKVLLVDDHQMMRAGVRRVISEQPGLRVVGDAPDGQALMDQVRTLQPDVVVMDVHFPGEDGITLSERLLAEFPAIRIIVLSADTDLATVQRALQAGVSGYVTKNAPPEEMLRAIREAFDQRIFLSGEIASDVVRDYMKLAVGRSSSGDCRLTERERLLLRLVAEGKRNKEIAAVLEVGVRSVETYRTRLMRKLNCASTADLTRYAIREGITPP